MIKVEELFAPPAEIAASATDDVWGVGKPKADRVRLQKGCVQALRRYGGRFAVVPLPDLQPAAAGVALGSVVMLHFFRSRTL